MTYRLNVPALALAIVVAICTPARTDSLDRITNATLRDYSARELERGAPTLEVTARVLYREALELIERGGWEDAQSKLLLAASLAGNYPDPLFTLAKIELLHGQPEGITHATEGMLRLAGNFRSQSLLAINSSLIFVIAAFGSLMLMLVVLTIKYWPLMNHKLQELYSKKYIFPPESWIGFLILIGLLVMRLGLACYAALLIIILWMNLAKKEKAVVLALVIIVSVSSLLSGYSSAFLGVLDPGSITWRLSHINERGADHKTIEMIEAIRNPAFEAERSYALGTILYRLGYIEEAKVHLMHVVDERSDFAPAYLNLGNVYFTQGDYDKALAGYQNVIALDYTNALAHYNIGQAYIEKMLFAESSSALKNANTFGIEAHRRSHPATRMRSPEVYEIGFEPRHLWAVALREGGSRNSNPLSEILLPYLLLPFHWLGYVLVGSVIAAIITSRLIPAGWKAFRCENCGKETCPDCADEETGLMLCSQCAEVIQGLTSVKVMEALLRHRRQKMNTVLNRGIWWKTLFFPGAAHIYHGKCVSGVLTASINIGAIMILLGGGFYLKDPRILSLNAPLWKIIVPAIVLALGYTSNLRIKPPAETRNYRILPTETHVETTETIREKPEMTPIEQVEDPVTSILDSL